MAEVFDAKLFESKLRRLASGYKKRYGDLLQYDVEEELARFNEYRPKLAKYAVDGVAFMQSAQQSKRNIIIEGANVRTARILAFERFLKRRKSPADDAVG